MSNAQLSLPDDVRSTLRDSGCVPAALVGDWLTTTGIPIEQAMLALLPTAAERARAPVSGYMVGAVALGMPSPETPNSPGALYLGANLEFSGLPLNCTVHAEQAAVNNAWLRGERGLQALAVTAPPCGHCRQFLCELTTAETLRVIVRNDAESAASHDFTLDELLPHAFGPAQLGIPQRLMSKPIEQRHLGRLMGNISALVGLDCHVPYSGNHAVVALELATGHVICGLAAESAAFNPTLTAMQSALSFLAMQTPDRGPLRFTSARMFELALHSSQRQMAEIVLASIAPGMKLE